MSNFILKRNGEIATAQDIRAAIMREVRILRQYSTKKRSDAVDQVLRDPLWIRFRAGMTLGAVARDGFNAALAILAD